MTKPECLQNSKRKRFPNHNSGPGSTKIKCRGRKMISKGMLYLKKEKVKVLPMRSFSETY